MFDDPRARLYVICDADACAAAGRDLVDFAAACLDGGARLLQVRAKRLAGRELLAAAAAIVDLAHTAGATVIVNDRADIARLCGADGVHVGQNDLTPLQARLVVGDDRQVGLSTHTFEQLDAGLREPVNYLAIGPVFETGSKATGYGAVGLGAVRAAARHAAARRLPVVAIGGITLDRAAAVIEAGAAAVAVISDLLTDDPAARVDHFLKVLRAS